MGEMGRVTCVICGREFDISEVEPIFTGRTRYRCFGCISDGKKQVNQRIRTSFTNGYAKRMMEKQRWK